MKKILLPVSMLFLLAYITAGPAHKTIDGKATYSRTTLAERTNSIGCAPPETKVTADANGRFIPALPGLGQHVYLISTKVDSAQFFFNQGINLYYSYHLRDAVASFKEAARFDSSAAMAYWGQALSMGPYYNTYTYKMKPAVQVALTSMTRLRAGTTEKEQGLIDAMLKRYSNDTTNADRDQLDKAYAAALSKLIKRYPEDDDIKALYIDAVMLQHKWDFWSFDGSAKQWTPELVKLCEGILKRDPHQPAGMHYYIHLTEAGQHPEKALAGADRLKDDMPGAAHMVHMATHSYQRNGLFAKGVLVNEESNTVYNREDSLAPMLGIGQNNIIHVYAVQSFCALNGGMYDKALPIYLRARERCVAGHPVFAQDPYAQWVYMLPEMARVRMGKWEEILQEAAPDPRWKYAGLLYHFARGMALASAGKTDLGGAELASLRMNLSDSLLNVPLLPFDKPAQCGHIAADILEASLLWKQGWGDQAITIFGRAVTEEDLLVYREPQQWVLPARQYLGACLLKMGKAKDAEKVYRRDLVKNPGNGWSLLGLYQSLTAQHKSSQAADIRQKYLKAFEAADVHPTASVF